MFNGLSNGRKSGTVCVSVLGGLGAESGTDTGSEMGGLVIASGPPPLAHEIFKGPLLRCACLSDGELRETASLSSKGDIPARVVPVAS